MSTALTVISDSSNLPAALGVDLTAAVDLAKAEKAASTRKAYGTDFRLFTAWCEARGVAALPAAPETVAAYLAAQAPTSKTSTLGRRVAAIRYAHKLAGLALPTDAEGVKATMRGIRRTFGSAKIRKAPAVAGKVLGMVATAPDRLSGLRDRALLLIGFGGALRRSELVALDVADIQETETGLLVKIRGSKTDQERAGATIAIARGDVAALPRRFGSGWTRPVFRMGRSSARSTRQARCGRQGLPADRLPTSSRRMPNAPGSTPAHSQVIPSGPASLRPPRGRAPQSSR